MPTLKQKRTDDILRVLRERKGQAKFGELFRVMFEKYGMTKNSFRHDLGRLKTSGTIEYPEDFPAGFEHENLIKLSDRIKETTADETVTKPQKKKKRGTKRKAEMTAELPKGISKDLEELGKTTRFRNIKMAVNYLNSQLQSMFVYRSRKTRDGKEAKTRKYWLQLVYAVNEQSVTTREQPPQVFQVEMVNAVCSKCGFEWRTSFGSWLTFSCPKCGSFEIGIEDKKKE
jgi:hypothetical protein